MTHAVDGRESVDWQQRTTKPYRCNRQRAPNHSGLQRTEFSAPTPEQVALQVAFALPLGDNWRLASWFWPCPLRRLRTGWSSGATAVEFQSQICQNSVNACSAQR